MIHLDIWPMTFSFMFLENWHYTVIFKYFLKGILPKVSMWWWWWTQGPAFKSCWCTSFFACHWLEPPPTPKYSNMQLQIVLWQQRMYFWKVIEDAWKQMEFTVKTIKTTNHCAWHQHNILIHLYCQWWTHCTEWHSTQYSKDTEDQHKETFYYIKMHLIYSKI